jgi:hypothetical protein
MIDIVLEKPFKDLNEVEKAFCVKELTIYSLSDHFASLQKELKEEAGKLTEEIKKAHKEDRSRELIFSQSDKELYTVEYMREIASRLDDSHGGKIFALRLNQGADNKEIACVNTIEPFFDQYCFTELDKKKFDRSKKISVLTWLNSTIQSHSKEVAIPEEKGAY